LAAFSQTARRLLQAAVILRLATLLFGVVIHGSLLLVVLLLILGVFSFVSVGVLISTLATRQETAMTIMMTLQFPMLFLSGVLFPVQQMPTMITTIWALGELKIPFIAAGGIGDARGFLGALGMGADGVMMGTAFMATRECSLGDMVKEAIIKTGYDNLELRYHVLAIANPKDLEEVMKLRNTMPMNEWLFMLERVNLKDPNWRDSNASAQDINIDSRLRMVSLVAGVIDTIPSVKEFVNKIIHDAKELVGNW
jgi:hypothetical protein